MTDMNSPVIEEFRANSGAVDESMGGFFKGKPLLLLNHTGAKSGMARTTPLVYAPHDGSYIVTASKGGADHHPHWFLNVRANPSVTIEVGAERLRARATIVEEGPDRDKLYAKMVAVMGQFADYEQKTDRRIPVVVLDPVD